MNIKAGLDPLQKWSGKDIVTKTSAVSVNIYNLSRHVSVYGDFGDSHMYKIQQEYRCKFTQITMNLFNYIYKINRDRISVHMWAFVSWLSDHLICQLLRWTLRNWKPSAWNPLCLEPSVIIWINVCWKHNLLSICNNNNLNHGQGISRDINSMRTMYLLNRIKFYIVQFHKIF